MSASIVFLNGRFLPSTRAVIPVSDRGFLYGDGLFETIRIVAGQPRHWALHFERLRRGAQFLHLHIPQPPEELLRQVLELIRLNAVSSALLRLTLSRGTGPRGYSPIDAVQPTLVMSLHAAPSRDEKQPGSWHLVTSTIRIPASDPLTRFKTCNRLHYVLARKEADDANADDALLLNQNGHIVESSCANLFWIRDDAIHTPPLNAGPLDGITRSRLLRLAQDLQLPILEKNAPPDTLRTCQGLFLTLTSHGIVRVASLDGELMPDHPWIARCHEALQS